VLLVDDHPLIRELIRIACSASPSVIVIGEAASGEEAVEMCRRTSPDVLILDLNLPRYGGLEVIRRLKAEGSGVRILVVTAHDDPAVLFDCRRLGVDGFIRKTEAVTSILEHLEALGSGRAASGDHAGAGPDGPSASGRMAGGTGDPTRREREVLRLLADGLTDRQIASRLMLAQRTAEWHVQRLYRKLGVTHRVEALARAVSLGLLDSPARSSA
jgi:DNA-binding NarL/FixJ family response regulator